ncbi:hypothetical protein BV20DRAFT_270999 [Pilatotrama ljubarskyi]|nr:hypothetical protein BV20DRAFT_270999 [Pilatotrama ljubarskyi]
MRGRRRAGTGRLWRRRGCVCRSSGGATSCCTRRAARTCSGVGGGGRRGGDWGSGQSRERKSAGVCLGEWWGGDWVDIYRGVLYISVVY